jgi:ferredoxin
MDQFLPRKDFQKLLNLLARDGYRCIGPRVRDGTIMFDTITKVTDLPIGYRDRQAPGRYRLEKTQDPRYFGWANGPQALKPLTFAPREMMWRVVRNEKGQLNFVQQAPVVQPTAVIGIRGCDLAALHIQDQHFCYQEYRDHYYNTRRRSLLLIAVDCSHPASTCFCHSTGDGPSVHSGFDIAMTELDEGFIVRAKSERGQAIMEELPLSPVTEVQQAAAAQQYQEAVAAQTRSLPSRNLKDALFANLDHPRWQEVAQRCLSCTNCTLVCPTCFCHDEVEVTDLEGRYCDHSREWDSCFTDGHSYMHGFLVREKTVLRYRQWLTHKLGSWHDQYGRSGCVGCGRCITWCPVGIDITEEAHAICGEGQTDIGGEVRHAES